MKLICACLCLAAVLDAALPAPADGFFFPEERRRQKKIEPVITPPVLPVLEHLERDPSTLLPHEKRANVKPRFGGGVKVRPSGNRGVTGSFSSSAGGPLGSQSASQSFSFGFSEGFSASQSASQSASFNGFGSSFSGSQASSQAASFSGVGASVSGASSSAASVGGSSFSGSQSSAFGFNGLGGFQPQELSFGDGGFEGRHRGVPNFPIPEFLGKGLGAAAFRSAKIGPSGRSRDGVITTIVLTD